MIQVNREEFLHRLELISPGLSPKEIVEQSSCIIIQKGRLYSYNEEIACSVPSGLPEEITGAVQAAPLIGQLRKWKEEVVQFEFDNDLLRIKGHRREAGIRMSSEILLPMDALEAPKKWVKLHDDFTDAIGMVEPCASTDENEFKRTCIHVHPEYMEAFDNYQITRYSFPTGVKEPILVRRDSLKYVQSRELTKMSLSDNWIHFKGAHGLSFSCVKYDEEYEQLDGALEMKGSKIVLPRSLADDVEAAQLFTEENEESNLVGVEIIPDKMRLTGTGASGWFKARAKLKYKGKPRKFLVAPNLLIELLKRQTDCEISEDKIRINGGKFVYVVSLDDPPPANNSTKTEDD